MIDTPPETSEGPLKALLKTAATSLGAVLERLQPYDIELSDDGWLFSAAETDPAAAAFLQVEGLRAEPRTRSEKELWTA